MDKVEEDTSIDESEPLLPPSPKRATLELKVIPLDQIILDTEFQVRGMAGESQWDIEHLQRLAASDHKDWPPLLVSPREEGGYYLLGGWHRYTVAAQVKGLTELPCRITPSADIVEAFRDNMRHGLPLSIADRKAYAVFLYHDILEQTGKAPSFRAIGREAGLDKNTAQAAIEADLSGTGEIHQQESSSGSDYSSKSSSDEVKRLVRLVMKAEQDKVGQSFLGQVFHKKYDPKQTAAYIAEVCREQMKEEKLPEAANAFAVLGESFTLAAARLRLK